MSVALTAASALDDLAAALAGLRLRQLDRPGAPEDGAVWTGIDNPGHTGTTPLIAGTLLLRAAGHAAADEGLLATARRAAAYLLRQQRPTGRLDLKDCNYDSDPDTAFAVQMLGCALLEARPVAARDAALAALVEPVERFLAAAAAGLRDGGFHTPNHRWVVASALALLRRLLPDRAHADGHGDALERLLAEGPDIDGDGCWLERSPAVYDAVAGRSALLVDRLVGWPAGRAATAANLRFDRTLFEDDATVETGLSTRQDRDRRVVPAGLVHVMILAARTCGDPALAEGAAAIWAAATPNPGDCFWLAWVLHACGEQPAALRALPSSYVAWHPENRFWRLRRGRFSASAFADTERALRVRHGAAELSALTIALCWHGHGRFIGRETTWDGAQLRLRSPGRDPGRRLGYSHPLGRPVAAADFERTFAERRFRAMPAAETTMTVREALEGVGIDLHLAADFGVDGVVGQLACDFPAGGTWECAGGALQTRPGQVIFLTAGDGAMRFGDDVIAIGPGADVHRQWELRDATPHGDRVRVVIGLRTPVDLRLRIRGRTGW